MRRVLLAVLLVVAAVIWVRINGPVEGRVLLELAEERGITTADLLSLVAVAMALVLVWPSRRRADPEPYRGHHAQRPPSPARPAPPQQPYQPPARAARRPGPPPGPAL
ncbi:hypothetical protein WCD74_01185 [Actinomycetospora sp. OC33-EN08]|uniref:Uncharacterized protein n=1 Tax=Actinomycetospora aurantiaca TaxID=3129233 RepID=A0ABU8MGA2_9PSEU